MNTLEIPSKGIKMLYPSTLEEMSTEQYLFYVDQLIRLKTEEIDFETFKLKVTYFLVGLYHKKKSWLKPKSVEELENMKANIVMIQESLSEIFTEPLREGSPVNLLKRVNIGGIEWIGPEDVLSNVTIGQFIDANSHFKQYLDNNDGEALKRFFATLWRPRRFFERLPSQYNERTLSFDVKRLKKIPLSVAMAAYYFFAACLEYMRESPLVLDGVEIDFSVLYRGSKSNQSPGSPGMKDVLFTLAESGVFGSMEQLKQATYLDVMLRLRQLHIESEKQKSKSIK